MTDLDLEAIKARAEKATPGPWDVEGPNWPGPDDSLEVFPKELGGVLAYVQPVWDDAEFIAHARADIPVLIAEVRRLRARLAITDDMVERAALAMARIDEWPNNEDLGGNPFTGTRDEEFRDEYMVMARDALEAALGEDDA